MISGVSQKKESLKKSNKFPPYFLSSDGTSGATAATKPLIKAHSI